MAVGEEEECIGSGVDEIIDSGNGEEQTILSSSGRDKAESTDVMLDVVGDPGAK
jgi:hypothetical protein